MEIITNYGDVLIILAIVFGVFMAWGIGANDVANAMGTSVGSGAVTIKQAIIIAVIFEFSGAILAGGEVTATIRKITAIIIACLIVTAPEPTDVPIALATSFAPIPQAMNTPKTIANIINTLP